MTTPTDTVQDTLDDPGMPTENELDQAFHDATETAELTEEQEALAREWFSVGAMEFAARARGVGVLRQPLSEKRIAELWYGGREPGHDVAPGYAVTFARAVEEGHGAGVAVTPASQSLTLDRYDAGLLGGMEGMSAEWWQDYIRAELDRAHDFYQQQADNHFSVPASDRSAS